MPDIFISYSRRDGDFGRKLHQTFTAQKKDIWMDWEDIPLTADWWTEIRRGIETSDNFVLIMSPDSIGSPVCQLEIEYARRLNKRIVPIFHRDPDFEASTISVVERTKHDEHLHRMMDGKDAAALMEDNKKVLATLNWVFFKEDDNFDEKFYQLSQIVDADLTHIRQHTRVQVKALEWVESGKNASFILSGVELASAENWLAASVDKQPQPTDLHREFIGASRRVEQARHRLLRGLQVASVVAGVLIVVATGMALFSVNQANTANERADYAHTEVALAEVAQQASDGTANYALTQVSLASTAQSQSDHNAAAAAAQVESFSATLTPIPFTLTPIPQTLTAVAMQIAAGEHYADAMRLSGEAIAHAQDFAGDPRTGALLAVQSLQRQYTGLADNTLLGLLDRFSLVRTFDDDAPFVGDSAFLPDGRLITAGAELKLWDVTTGELIKTLAPVTTAVSGGLIVSPDGSTLILVGPVKDLTDEFAMWSLTGDTATEQTFPNLPDGVTVTGDINFAPDGSPYLILNPIDECRMWNPLNGKSLQFDGHCFDAAFSPDGRLIAVDSEDTLVVYPVTGGAAVATITHSRVDLISTDIQRFAFSPDSHTLAVIDENRVDLWDYHTGRPIRTFSGHERPIRDVLFTPDGKSLITNGTDGTVRVWDVMQGQEVQSVAPGGTFATVTVSPDGQWLVTTGNSQEQPVRLWSLTATTERLLKPGKLPVTGLAFSPDSTTLVGATYDGAAAYEIATGSVTQIIEDSEAGEGDGFVMAMNGTQVALMDVLDLSVTDIVTGEGWSFTDYDSNTDYGSLIFTPDGTQLITVGNDAGASLVVWDVATGEVVHRWQPPAPDNPVTPRLAISPDGKTLLISQDVLTAVDLSSGAQTTLRKDTAFASPVAYSPDGKWLAVFVSEEGKTGVMLLDASTGAEVRRFDAPLPPSAMAFSPDGKWLAFDNGDRAIQIFDAATGQAVRVLTGGGGFTAVAFSPDGKWLAAGSSGGDIRLWNAGYEDTLAYACQRLAGFDFTPEEIRHYELDSTPTCP